MIGAGGCGIRSAQDAKNSTGSGTAGTLIIFDSFTVFPLIDFALLRSCCSLRCCSAINARLRASSVRNEVINFACCASVFCCSADCLRARSNRCDSNEL